MAQRKLRIAQSSTMRTTRVRLQVSVCTVAICVTLVSTQTDRQTAFDQCIWI